jgi:hypothetical protein
VAQRIRPPGSERRLQRAPTRNRPLPAGAPPRRRLPTPGTNPIWGNCSTRRPSSIRERRPFNLERRRRRRRAAPFLLGVPAGIPLPRAPSKGVAAAGAGAGAGAARAGFAATTPPVPFRLSCRTTSGVGSAATTPIEPLETLSAAPTAAGSRIEGSRPQITQWTQPSTSRSTCDSGHEQRRAASGCPSGATRHASPGGSANSL